MDFLTLPFILLALSVILVLILMNYILHKKPLKQLHYVMLTNCVFSFILSIGVLVQDVCSTQFGINPIYFENIIYIGTCFLPVSLFFTSLVLLNTKITFKKRYILFFVIPIFSLLVLWTNDFHHLFYTEYSLNISEMKFGSYFYVHTIYSYTLNFISIALLIYASVKNSGFFSKQSALIIIGTLIPTFVNLSGYLGIFHITVYATPISFNIAIVCYIVSIFKFKFLSVAPIALQRVVDRISDSYIILNEENRIIDFNQTFLDTFHIPDTKLRNVYIYDLLKDSTNFSIDATRLEQDLKSVTTSDKTIQRNIEFSFIHKFFVVEISSIFNRKAFLGTILLFKDISQHVSDLNTIKDNQDKLMEKERLASLGQLIGGIAHNLKTPIMSISGASEGLSDLVKEYDVSIDDPEVTANDHHDIAKDMNSWIVKIKEYTEYMSDVITAVKGQAVTLSDEQSVTFTIEELVKRVDILMKHELKSALINLLISVQVDPMLILKGNVNSLVQVINNMISNSIQAYHGATDKTIALTISSENDTLTITITDEAGGLPKEVEQKLFKEMITTKGKNGTGLGLFMSYSNIRAHFNGNITFETIQGKGTSFHISLPL